MSERPIQVGDLVQVVRGHECYLGYTMPVVAIVRQNVGFYCPKCGQRDLAMHEHIAATAEPGKHGIPISWLKRIPPLSELEGEKTEEKLREPA